MENLRHVMVDIETMGTKSGSVILSIGAVQFDLKTGETGKTFEINISMDDSIKHGLKTDVSTIIWWMKQSDEARKRFTDRPGVGLIGALHMFSDFILKCGGEECEIWGNSARFDLGLLQDAYNKIDTKIPWHYRNERCVRTLYSLYPAAMMLIEFEGTPHTPVDDCKHQIKCCSAVYNSLITE